MDCGDRKALVSHAREHLRQEFLTVRQVQLLRKIAGKSVLLPQPSTSSSSPDQDTTGLDPSDDDSVALSRRFSSEQTTTRIHGNAGVRITILPAGSEKHSLLNLFGSRREQIKWNLDIHLKRWRNVRWYLVAKCKMVRFDSEGNIRDEERPAFRSKSQVLLAQDAAQNQIDEAFFKINSSMETFCSNASGWVLEEVLAFDMFVFRYSPLGGNCGDLDIPQELANKRALITVTGRPINSKDCFIWAVIAAIHHKSEEHCGAVHWSTFQEAMPLYRLPDSMSEGDTVTLDKITDFEKKNRVSVNVFAYDGSIFPLRVSDSSGNERGHANLLLLHALGEDKTLRPFQHYCAVKDLGRLISGQNDGNHKLHVCPRCLNHKYTADDLAKHTEHCKLLEPLRVRMPESKLWNSENIIFRSRRHLLSWLGSSVSGGQYWITVSRQRAR